MSANDPLTAMLNVSKSNIFWLAGPDQDNFLPQVPMTNILTFTLTNLSPPSHPLSSQPPSQPGTLQTYSRSSLCHTQTTGPSSPVPAMLKSGCLILNIQATAVSLRRPPMSRLVDDVVVSATCTMVSDISVMVTQRQECIDLIRIG